MAELLKRIVVSQRPAVLIEDLRPKDSSRAVFLRHAGDSRDLLAADATGQREFTLEMVAASKSLDDLITLGHLKLYDEDGTELTNTTAKQATNLTTIKDVERSIDSNIEAINLSDLLDVTISDIASGEILKWDGSEWINNTLDEANIDNLVKSVDTKTSGYTIERLDNVILCNGTFQVFLPAAADNYGINYDIKNIGTGIITVNPDGNETIDGGLTAILECQYESIRIISNTSNWYIL